jgi:hypothetical protein
MIGFIAPYIFTQFGTTGNYNVIVILHTFQFTVTYALGFSDFTSRIPATDISQSSCNLKSHMKSLCTAKFLSCPYSATANSEDSNPFNCKLISRQTGFSQLDPSLPTRLLCLYYFSSDLLCPFITPWHGPYGKHSLYC